MRRRRPSPTSLTLVGLLFCTLDRANAVQVSCGRRRFGHVFGTALVCGGNTLAAGAVPPERGAPTEAAPCIFGEGEGCAAAADSPIIKELQQRSAQNKEKYEKQMLDRYNFNNYKDYLGVYDKTLVKHKDGSYEALTKDELMKGMKEKRIGVGYAGTGWTNYADRNPYFFLE